MKTVTIHREHTPGRLRLRLSESNLCCIQCGLLQITLSPAQTAKVHGHCHCMASKLQYENLNSAGSATMVIDPSQLDLRGESIVSWSIG